MTTKKELSIVEGDRRGELYNALLELNSIRQLIEHHIADMTMNIAEGRGTLRKIQKKIARGEAIYKKNYQRDILYK